MTTLTHIRARWLGWLALALCVALTGAASILMLLIRPHRLPKDVGLGVLDLCGAVALLAFPAVGALILSRRPGHPIGRLYSAVGLAWSLYVFFDAWTVYGWYANPGALPAARVAAWLATGKGALILFFTASMLLLLYPDGRLPSRRWRIVFWTTLGSLASVLAAFAFRPGELVDYPGVTNPLAIAGTTGLFAIVARVGLIALGLCILASTISVVRRLRRATGVARQQLEWIAWAAVLVAAALVVALALQLLGLPSVVSGLIAVTASMAIPIATGVAILRHRLYDIDLLINRTLVYAALSACLIVGYALAVVALQRALGPLTRGSDLAVAASTLAVAGLFGPARTRIQSLVDRRFYRRKYDAERIIAAFSQRLRDELDLHAISAEVLAVARETMQPEHASLWLRPEAADGPSPVEP